MTVTHTQLGPCVILPNGINSKGLTNFASSYFTAGSDVSELFDICKESVQIFDRSHTQGHTIASPVTMTSSQPCIPSRGDAVVCAPLLEYVQLLPNTRPTIIEIITNLEKSLQILIRWRGRVRERQWKPRPVAPQLALTGCISAVGCLDARNTPSISNQWTPVKRAPNELLRYVLSPSISAVCKSLRCFVKDFSSR